MAEVHIRFGNRAHERGSIKLNAFQLGFDDNADRAFKEIGVMFERDIKKKLSGPSPGDPYPGVRTGRLRSSVHHRPLKGFGEFGVEIGPGVVYAAIHEFGGEPGMAPGAAAIKPRPYVGPSFDENADKIIPILEKHIFRPLR